MTFKLHQQSPNQSPVTQGRLRCLRVRTGEKTEPDTTVAQQDVTCSSRGSKITKEILDLLHLNRGSSNRPQTLEPGLEPGPESESESSSGKFGR